MSSSPFLRDQYAGLTKLPLPTLGMSRASRSAMTPFWKLIRGYGGHLIQLCSYMTMHPAVAEGGYYQPSRAAEAEFRSLSRRCACCGGPFRRRHGPTDDLRTTSTGADGA